MESGSKTEEVAGYNSNTAKKARLQSMLSALLDDPILSDVSKKPTLADVDTLISLELGSAMKVSVVKMDYTSYDVAVLNSATVADLKLAIMKKTNEIEQAQLGHRHISWFILPLMLLRELSTNIPREGSTGSSTDLASDHDHRIRPILLVKSLRSDYRHRRALTYMSRVLHRNILTKNFVLELCV